MDRPLVRWAVIAYIVIAAIAAAVLFMQVMTQPRLPAGHDVEMLGAIQQRTAFRLENLEQEVAVLRDLLQGMAIDPARMEELRATLAEFQKLQGEPALSILDRLNEVEMLASRHGEVLGDLKSTLNPTNPEEVFTVLRLGDKFELLSQKIEENQRQASQLRDDLNKDIANIYRQTWDQMDSIRVFMTVILLLLAPILSMIVFIVLDLRKHPVAPGSTANPNEPSRPSDGV